MVALAVGKIVLVKFPFSDLSGSKMRPAVVLADSGNNDWIMCQITSNPYADANAIRIDNDSFDVGTLQRVSYIRPGKLFTGNNTIIVQSVGQLTSVVKEQVVAKVVAMIQGV